jgi:Protein of unknown function (DUF3047)
LSPACGRLHRRRWPGVAAVRRVAWPVMTALAALQAAHGSELAPLAAEAGPPPPPWAWAGLPGQTLPSTRFSVQRDDGRPVLRVEAVASYGNLVHPLDGAKAGELHWRWRVERPLAAADLRTKAGDDVALKVCALFDMPREKVPFVERQLLRLAESRVGAPLPNATLCYVWAPSWPRGTVVPNAFSARVRYITLGNGGPQWQAERQDLAADFLRAFGDEAAAVPPLLAVAVGADADNTGGHSVGFIADLRHASTPGP